MKILIEIKEVTFTLDIVTYDHKTGRFVGEIVYNYPFMNKMVRDSAFTIDQLIIGLARQLEKEIT